MLGLWTVWLSTHDRAAKMDSDIKNDLAIVRHALAKSLRTALSKAYGGTMPSLSRVARDLALRSPNMMQVSNETIRKWLIGASIPSAIAILALADWLGSEVLLPLMEKNQRDGKTFNRPNDNNDRSAERSALIHYNGHALLLPSNEKTMSNQETVDLLQKLSAADHALVVSLINALNTKQPNKDSLLVKNNAPYQTHRK